MAAVPLVLVVDDDEDIRGALCAVLEEEGYQATALPNGLAALEFLRRGRLPAVILLDLMMPVMDGWQFRAIQKADPFICEIPVVVITASGFSPELASQLGVDWFVTKPLQLDSLFQVLTALDVGHERKRTSSPVLGRAVLRTA